MSEMIAIGYADLATARQAADNVVKHVESGGLAFDDLAIVERRTDGKIEVHHPTLAKGATLGGALGGGMLGAALMAPLLGIALGAATGAGLAKAVDEGIDVDFLKKLADELGPGRAAMIVLVSSDASSELLSQVEVPGAVIETSLDPEREQALQRALEAARQSRGEGLA
jgi:uncharacterized membrane protein